MQLLGNEPPEFWLIPLRFWVTATVSFASFVTAIRFKIAPLDRSKIAYSNSTPKRLARLVALVPVKPN